MLLSRESSSNNSGLGCDCSGRLLGLVPSGLMFVYILFPVWISMFANALRRFTKHLSDITSMTKCVKNDVLNFNSFPR